MPPLEKESLHQKAVLRMRTAGATGYDKFGDPNLDTAVEVPCRWQQRKSEVTGQEEGAVPITVDVDVDRDIAVGSRMWLGTLVAYNALSPVVDEFQVVDFNSVPDLRARHFKRDVVLHKVGN